MQLAINPREHQGTTVLDLKGRIVDLFPGPGWKSTTNMQVRMVDMGM
jgi:hypothetical protein